MSVQLIFQWNAAHRGGKFATNLSGRVINTQPVILSRNYKQVLPCNYIVWIVSTPRRSRTTNPRKHTASHTILLVHLNQHINITIYIYIYIIYHILYNSMPWYIVRYMYGNYNHIYKQQDYAHKVYNGIPYGIPYIPTAQYHCDNDIHKLSHTWWINTFDMV